MRREEAPKWEKELAVGVISYENGNNLEKDQQNTKNKHSDVEGEVNLVSERGLGFYRQGYRTS